MGIRRGRIALLHSRYFYPELNRHRQQDESHKTFFRSSAIRIDPVLTIFIENPHIHCLHASPTHSFHILLINSNEPLNSNSHVYKRHTSSSERSCRWTPWQQPSRFASQSSSVSTLRTRNRHKVLLVRFRDGGSQLRTSAGRCRRVRQDTNRKTRRSGESATGEPVRQDSGA